MTAAACCLFFISVFMGIKIWKLKRDVFFFSDRLIRCLNDMTLSLIHISGSGENRISFRYSNYHGWIRYWKKGQTYSGRP